MKLSEKIIVSRKRQGLSQVDLADALGVSRQSVSKWETDESKPDISKLPVLAKVLGVSIDWLLSEEDVEETQTDDSCGSNYMDKETTVKNYPDWVDKAPGFIGNAIKKYGWIFGVKFIIAGAIFTVIGIVARVMSYNFIVSGNKASKMVSSFGDGFGNQAFGDSAFSEINNQSWTAFSTITGLIIGIGVFILVGGIILTVILKRWSKKSEKF